MATVGGNLLQRPRCWYFRAGNRPARHEGRQEPGPRGRQPLPRHLPDRRRRPVRQPVEPGRPPDRPGRQGDDRRAEGERTVPVEELYRVPKTRRRPRADRRPRRAPDQGDRSPPPRARTRSYEVRQKQAHDWPLVLASVNLELDGDGSATARVVLYGVAPIPWRSEAAEKAITGKPISIGDGRGRRRRRPSRGRSRCR